MSEVVNILIRTSQRPNCFRRVMQSILSQGLPDVRVLVTVDTPETEEYVRSASGVSKIITVPRLIKEGPGHAPYNLHMNALIEAVEEGWVFFMDDDDYYLPGALAEAASLLGDTKKAHIFKTFFQGFGRNIPTGSFGKGLVLGDICTPSIVLHHTLAKEAAWGDRSGGDFRYIDAITKSPLYGGLEWHDMVIGYVPSAHTGEKFDIEVTE